MRIHYGTLHDCLVLAGRVCWNCTGSINQALFRSVEELGELPHLELMPWDMIEALVSYAQFVLALIGVVLAIAFASSAAAIGLVLVLVASGALPLVAALALVLGANVGSTVTALLTALSGGSVVGR